MSLADKKRIEKEKADKIAKDFEKTHGANTETVTETKPEKEEEIKPEIELPKKSEAINAWDNMEFEKQDLGTVQFHRFTDSKDGKEKGTPVFVGKWSGVLFHGEANTDGTPNPEYNEEAEIAKGNSNAFNGLKFHDKNDELILISANYALRKYFVEENAEINAIYKIEWLETKVIDKGRELQVFRVSKAVTAKA